MQGKYNDTQNWPGHLQWSKMATNNGDNVQDNQ